VDKVNSIKDRIGLIFISLVGIWIIIALFIQVTFLVLHFAGREDLTTRAANWFTWTFDGRFKNSPGNIWYQAPTVSIGTITNKVKLGPVAGNRKLEFGIKNILEEVLQDKGYDIDNSSEKKIDVDIVYLDVLKTQSSFSVLHSNKESVVVRLQGTLGKKKVFVEESADEISMSTIIIDEGGKFNQQNLSSALKKACNSLVNKLLDTK
jgi:hypothetical protein